jgi:hypothetical protein
VDVGAESGLTTPRAAAGGLLSPPDGGADAQRDIGVMGWLVAIVVLPILLASMAVYAVMKLAVLMLRVAFMPLTLRRR